MNRKRVSRVTAGVVALATVALGMELIGEGASAAQNPTTASYTCTGRTDDKAQAKFDTSAGVLKTLGQISGTGSSTLTLDVTVTVDAPTKVRKSAGPFDAAFNVSVKLPDALIDAAKKISLTNVTVLNSRFAVDYNGAANGSFESTVPSRDVSFATTPVVINQSFAGKITPERDGKIIYRAGPSNLQIALNKTVAGIEIGTISVNCVAAETVGTTQVAPPGTPNSLNGGLYTVVAPSNQVSEFDVLSKVTPDEGNPILTDSLKVTKGADRGIGILRSGKLYYVPATSPTDYSTPVELQICGKSVPIAAEPQINEKQTLSLPKYLPGQTLNAHPISLKLSVNGQVSPALQLSYFTDLFGQAQPTPQAEPGGNQDFAWWYGRFNGRYVAPSAATLQATIEATPGVGFGNVKVTELPYTTAEIAGGANPNIDPNRYVIEFVGALGGRVLPAVSIANWNTWVNQNVLGALTAVLNAPPSTGPTTTTLAPPDTTDVLNAKLIAGLITFDEWGVQVGRRLSFDLANSIPGVVNNVLPEIQKWFPGAPGSAVKSAEGAQPFKAATETGPLCTDLTVTYKTAGTAVAGITQTKACSTTKVVRTKVKVKGRTRYVTTRVRVPEACCPKVVTKRVKTRVNGRTRYVSQKVTTQVACSTIRTKRRR